MAPRTDTTAPPQVLDANAVRFGYRRFGAETRRPPVFRMNAALRPDVLDVVGPTRLLVIDPDAPSAVLTAGSRSGTHPASTV